MLLPTFQESTEPGIFQRNHAIEMHSPYRPPQSSRADSSRTSGQRCSLKSINENFWFCSENRQSGFNSLTDLSVNQLCIITMHSYCFNILKQQSLFYRKN